MRRVSAPSLTLTLALTSHVINLLLGPTVIEVLLSPSCKPPSMLRQMIGRGFISPPPILVVNGSMMPMTRIRGVSWQNAFNAKIRGTQLLLSSMQQMRSHSTKKPQGKAAKKNKNDENGPEHSASTSGKDELHTHSHSILGHSHTHGGDEHEHGHDPEQILAALKGSGV